MSKITYNPEVKVLNIRLNNAKVIDSDMFDDCILDYDKDGNITNIEIIDVEPETIRVEGKKNHKKFQKPSEL